jgi:SAM-dependent methyltransferase
MTDVMTDVLTDHPASGSLASPSDDATGPGAGDAPRPADALADELFTAALSSLELATVHLGLTLGLYAGLRDHGPCAPAELAHHTALDERYVREWLEQQAMAQLVTCLDPDTDPAARRYALPPAAVSALLDETDPAYLGPLAHLAVGALLAVRDVERVYRDGTGVPFDRYGAEVRHGLGRLNGASFDRSLVDWIAAMPDVEEVLRTGARPRILDLGCGTGRSALAMARAYPRAEVRGVDLDVASVEEARRAAAEAGLADRVTFSVGDAADLGPDGSYHLVTILEALHDMGDPVGALRAARHRLADGGAVLVADQLTRDRFVPDGDPLERFQYGCSVLHCLPATRAEDHVVAHGTVIRPGTVDAWARDAGFAGAAILDVEDPFWRFCRL